MTRSFVINLVAAVAAIVVPPLVGTAGMQPSFESFAQQLVDPKLNDPSLHAYPETDKTCLEWTDSCRTCQRVGNTGVCPNIGIACQPKPIVCVRREEPAKPAEPVKPEAPATPGAAPKQ
jgi:hypothetical protein